MSTDEAVAATAPAEEVPAEAAPKKAHKPVEGEEDLKLPEDGSRIKRPVRPDDSDTRKQIDALQATIQKNKRRVEEIKEEIEARRSGRSKGSSEQQGVKNQLAELRQKFQALVAQKQGIRQQIDVLAKARDAARQNINSLKSSVKYTSVEQIDARITELEGQIAHSSLSLNEEKNILEQIKQLKKTRGSVGALSAQMTQLSTDASSVEELRDAIKAVDEQINGVKAQEEVLRTKLTELRAKEAEQGSDIPGLIQERDECREVCKAAYAKIQDLRAEHDAEWDTYKRQNKLFRLQLAADRERRNEQFAKERAERDAARAARMAENMPEPFDKEVTTCEQLVAYLSKFVVAQAADKAEEKKEVAVPEGFKPLEKKATDEADAWLMGTGGKKGKGAKKGGVKAAVAAPSAPKLTHSVDILEAFAVLKLEVPTSRDKAAALVPEVEAKKVAFLAKRQEVKEKGEAAAAAGGEGAAAEDEAAPGAEGEASTAADKPAAAAKGGKKGSKAPPKLDDAESWPSIGGAPAAAKPSAAEDADAEEEEEASEEEAAAAAAVDPAPAPEPEPKSAWGAKPAPAPTPAAPAAGNGGLVSVKLTVSEEGSVSLAIDH